MNKTTDEVIRFCIVTTQRSGSTWLMDLLASHPRVRAYNEVFIPERWHRVQRKPGVSELYAAMQPQLYFYQFQARSRRPRPWATFDYLDLICAPSAEYDAVGFKLMLDQWKRHLELTWKLKRDAYRVVHLIRENFLDSLISTEMVRKRGIPHASRDLPPDQVYIDPATLVHRLGRLERQRRRGEWLLRVAGLPVLRLTYEGLCEDPEGAIGSISDFLGVERRPLRSELKKLNRAAHWESIANYEEVRRALAGTAYESLLGVPMQGESMAVELGR
ncbi:MAG: sulfotransferase [Chloroflexi bacterium]|nr:sulfotransferase [Chloroflexota bacterium]